MDDNFVNIPFPRPVIEKIEKRMKDMGFSSAKDYILYILNEVLDDKEDKTSLSEEEEAQVKETLKKLGYLKDE